MKYTHTHYKRGQAVLIAALFFVGITVAIVMGISGPALRAQSLVRSEFDSKKSYLLAESLIEDMTYRLKKGILVNDLEVLTIDNFTSSGTITSVENGKIVTVLSDVDSAIRAIKTELSVSTGSAFYYGVQSGLGGFSIGGGAEVNGNIYSNGPIEGSGGAKVNGNAVSALSAPPTAQLLNEGPLPEENEIFFGKSNETQDLAQSFTATDSQELSKVSFYIRKINWPQNITIRITPDDAGVPMKTTLASASLQAYLVGSSYGWYEIPLSVPVALEEGSRYWVVLDGATNTSNYYALALNNAIPSERSITGKYNTSSWDEIDPVGYDSYFRIYTGGSLSEIAGTGGYIGSIEVSGDAWADSIRSAFVFGEMWCQSATITNKSCDTTHGSPPETQFPISDSNVNSWKDEALAGGEYSGDFLVGWQGASLGPKKITGNLSVGGGGVLTLTGTVWVEGDVSVTGGASIELDSSYGENSGVLVIDRVIDISGGTNFSGSGFEGSYPLVVTTSECPNATGCNGKPAIELSGGSGAIVLVAQNGTVSVNGGTAVRSVSGYRVELSGGSSIDYESGLADLSFQSGPSGGYEIDSWTEAE